MGGGMRKIKEGFENWRRSEARLFTKMKLTAKNNLIKIRTRKDCCGNYGEPGC